VTTAEAPAEDVEADGLESEEGPSALRNIVEWVVILAGALVIAVLVKAFLFQAFFIPSGSMENTLQIHDHVLVNKLSYKLHDIHRGDIVVFERPPREADPNIKDLIKRVIAVEGDVVESRDNTMYVNDKPLVEPYRKSAENGLAVPRTTIAPGMVWVMGDNRTNSADSRVFGAIEAKSVVGRAFVRIWPIGDFSLL
jgi:signal peptidase I